MPSLPVISGREVVRAFTRAGWQMVRQRGSHMIMVKNGHIATLSVPDHKDVARGTLRSLIRSSGLTVERVCDVIELIQKTRFSGIIGKRIPFAGCVSLAGGTVETSTPERLGRTTAYWRMR